MNPRSIRRAAERKARKNEQKQARLQDLISAETQASNLPDASAFRPLSPARLAANRANAALSTGPSSDEGRAISSLNAVKTGLTGRTVLLPSDDAAAYSAHLAEYEKEYRPQGLRERELVQEGRLRRTAKKIWLS